jgi:hypothetical protein
MYKITGADGKVYGPVTVEQVRTWISESRANAQTKVLLEGTTAPAPGTISIAHTQPPKTNSMALSGMIMGILSITCGLCCYGLPFNVLGIIFSLIGLSQIKSDPIPQKGRGMAIAGLVLSIVSIVLALLLLALGLGMNRNEILQKLQKQMQQ